MRVCFVSYFNVENKVGDIGTKNVAKNLANEVSKKHEVMRIDTKEMRSWKNAKDFKPDIIHFVLAPTTSGFIVAKVFSLFCSGAKVVMSAPNPTLSCRWLISHLGPDIILVQSLESEKAFQSLGFQTRFLSNGVDTNRFVSRSRDSKEKLRDKYHIDRKKVVILHVGPIIQKRDIELLMKLQGKDTQVIIVGRDPYDPKLFADLNEKGAIVMLDYLENIEEVYALSDYYVFPTDPGTRGASIETPLSILESMSCNLPVVTTRYGALPRIFKKDGDGLFFVEKEEDIIKAVEAIKNDDMEIKTRKKVLSYSWENVTKKLEKIYEELLR